MKHLDKNDLASRYGQRIKNALKENNLTQNDLALFLNKTRPRISQMIKGSNPPKFNDIERINEFFNRYSKRYEFLSLE